MTFDELSALFRTLSNYSDELLSHPIAVPQPLARPSSNTTGQTTTLKLQPCTDQDPAHMGELDASQQWALDAGTGALRNAASGLCVDALPKVYDAVTLRSCDGVGTDTALQWAYNSTSQQYASAATAPLYAALRSPR